MAKIQPYGSFRDKAGDLEQPPSLHTASEHDAVHVFRNFLETGASLSSTSGLYRYTPAHWASYAGSIRVMNAIIQHVCDDSELNDLLFLRDWLNKTPLHTACFSGKLRIVCMFLKLELDGRISRDMFDAKDIFGKTPMMWAMAQGHVDIVEVLILRDLYHLLPHGKETDEIVQARSMILKARAVALPNFHEQGNHMKEDVEGIQSGGPQDGEDPTMAAPLPALVDEGLSKELLWMVVKACSSGGFNILLVLLRIKAVLSEVACFPEMEAYTQALVKDLLDKCKTKEQAQAMLSPITGDATVKNWANSIPTDPMMLALEQGNKQFIAHKHVQALLTDKFDPMGSYEYSSKPTTVLFWAISALFIYMWWAVTFTWLLVLRPFSHFLIKFSEKGSTKNVDTRFPWHLPYNKWLASYMTLLVMTTLLSYLVTHSSPIDSLEPEEIVLIIWAVGTLIDKALEGLYVCLNSGLHLLDIASALFFIGYFVARVSYITQTDTLHVPPLGVVTRASDMLAVSVCCSVLRLLGVFVISPSFGPLLVMVKRMLLVDFARFLALLVVVFIAFGLAMVSLFKPLCVDQAYKAYDLYWDYSWQNDGLGGAIVHLLFQLFGVGSSQEAWAQKPVTGAIFFIIFIVIVGLLLLNLLIAMLSTSYSTVLETSDQEYKFNRALVIREYGSREAIYPPLNILHLLFGFIGNNLRKAVYGGRKGIRTVKLVQTSNQSSKFFAWYFPTGADEKWFLQCRSILFQKFVLGKDGGC